MKFKCLPLWFIKWEVLSYFVDLFNAAIAAGGGVMGDLQTNEEQLCRYLVWNVHERLSTFTERRGCPWRGKVSESCYKLCCMCGRTNELLPCCLQ